MDSFSYALDRLHKFNRLVGETPQLAGIFITKDFNFLQSFQNAIFFEFKYLYEKKSLKSYRITRELRDIEVSSSWLCHFLALIISFLAFSKIVLTRAKVLIFCVDKVNSKYKSDFRVEGIYEFLNKNSIKYGEIMHTIIGGHFKKFLFQRRRTIFYLESIDSIFKLFVFFGFIRPFESPKLINIDFSVFGSESDIFKFILQKYLTMVSQSRFRIEFFKKILPLTAAKVLLTIDDPRDYNELVAAFRAKKKNVYAFQHGAFSKYTVGFIFCGYGQRSIIKPNKLYTWGKYWKDELIRLGTYFNEEELGFGGDPKTIIETKLEDTEKSSDKDIWVLMPYEIEAPKNEVVDYVYEILKCPSVKFIFKTRSDASDKSQMIEYGFKQDMPPNFFVMSSVPQDIMNKVDLVIGVHSTFLYEVLRYLKPVYILKTPLDYAEGMVKNGLADYMDKNGDICQKIKQVDNFDLNVLHDRRDKFYKDFGSLEKVLQSITNVLDKRFQL